MWVIKRYPVFKAFLDILEHWEVVQMIQGTLRDVLKKVAGERPGDPTKLCGQAKNCRPLHTIFFKTFLMCACFGHSLKDFKVGMPTHAEK